MTIAAVGTLGSTGVGTGSSIALTTSAACEAGHLAVVVVCKENVGTTNNANTNEITGVSDSAGNTWAKAYEYCRTGGAACDGSVVAVFFSRVANDIALGGTIQASFSSSVAGSSIVADEFTVDNPIALFGTPAAETTASGTDAGSLAVSGLASAEYLYVRGIGCDVVATTLTPTASYTNLSTTAGTGQRVLGEFIISTGTSGSSNPTLSSTLVRTASVFVALAEAPVAFSGALLMGMM